MKIPEQTTAAVLPRYLGGEVLIDSATLKWSGLFARRYRFARVVDGFLVPATAEPLITCQLKGSAEFQERDIGGVWLPRRVRRGDCYCQDQTQYIDHNVPLTTLGVLRSIVAPIAPFCWVATLWLSTIAALGQICLPLLTRT